MAAIHDLLKQITDPKLRERIARQYDDDTRQKKFGLVYQQHLPEVVPIYSAKPRRGDLVAKRVGTLSDTWRVRRLENGMAHLVKPRNAGEKESAGERTALPVAELLVVKQFGEPIFPTLVPMDSVQNGPADAPWHTLIEADNYHALQLLEYLYAEKVDCIYIDPPYNTGAKDWKYNNDYVDGNDSWRHSKWLSFMEKRLRLAKKLLKPDTGVLICTIDEHEVHHLGVLMEEVLPASYRQMVTIVITSRGVAAQGLARVEEHALFAYQSSAAANATSDNFLTTAQSTGKSNPWASLLRRGTNASPFDRANLVYPILIDQETHRIVGVGETLDEKVKRGELQKSDLNAFVPDRTKGEAWPIRSDGRLGTWQVGPSTLLELLKNGFVKLGRYHVERNSWAVNYLKRGPISKVKNGELIVVAREWEGGPVVLEYADDVGESKRAKTVWNRTLHDAGTYGSTLLQTIVGNRAFDFPKSLYAVRDALAVTVGENKTALVVDFFAGSGTTLNATLLLNQADQGSRRCILVTNNEVKASDAENLRANGVQIGETDWEKLGVCRSVTWPRSKFCVVGARDDGTSLRGEYFTGQIVDAEKRRTFRNAAFVAPEDFRVPASLAPADLKKAEKAVEKKKLAFVSMIDALPQNSVKPGCRFIVSEDHKASVLFDPDAAAEWLEALAEQDHISDFYIVAGDEKQFKALKAQVDDLLGPLIVQEEEKRPMSAGFPANVAYFKLDFLDKDRVELGAAFKEILPLLWMRSGAIGPSPTLPNGPLPEFFVPESSPFAVLLNETRVTTFREALLAREGLRHVYVVTDAEEAFRAISGELRIALIARNPDVEFVQLYRDYLVNFTINTRAEDAAAGIGGVA